MRRLLIALVAMFLLPLLGVLIVLLVALETEPLVVRGDTISPDSIAQARKLLAQHDPRRLQRGEQATADLPASLLDDAANYLASRYLKARAAFTLTDDTAAIALSLRVPAIVGGSYLNLRAVMNEAEGEPRVVAANVGPLSLPPAIVQLLLASAIQRAGLGDEWEIARTSVRRLTFDSARRVVAVSYVWQPEVLDRARLLAIAPADVSRLEKAQRALSGTLDHYAPRSRVPFSKVLESLLNGADDASPMQQRASLLVLATYLAGQPLARLVPEARQWPRPRPVKLILLGRDDSAQHFAISAALAAWAGEPAAQAIGVQKEIDDSRHGSGFSFADLAADRAGTRFGELVVNASPRLARALRDSLTDADLAPSLAGLPEYLSEAEFQRRYGGIGSAAYREVEAEIDRRLALLPLYR